MAIEAKLFVSEITKEDVKDGHTFRASLRENSSEVEYKYFNGKTFEEMRGKLETWNNTEGSNWEISVHNGMRIKKKSNSKLMREECRGLGNSELNIIKSIFGNGDDIYDFSTPQEFQSRHPIN